jgi:NIMA (never in mitosis gene a)-related kinase
MKNDHIVGFKEAFIESNHLCIVMEYMNNGDLFQKIEQHEKAGIYFPEETIWNIFIQVLNKLI